MRALALGFTTAVLLLAVPARGAATDDKKTAALHFQKARSLFDAGDFEGALRYFQAAYDAAPSYEVLYNVALCQKRLNRVVAAARSLEDYLRQGGKKVSGARRSAVDAMLEELRASTGTLSVLAPGDPADVFVDGFQVGTTPLEGLRLDPGSHKFLVTRKGFEPLDAVREIVAGPNTTLSFELREVVVLSVPAPQPAPASAAPQILAPEERKKSEEPPPPPRKRGRALLATGILTTSLGGLLLGGAIACHISSAYVSGQLATLHERGGTWSATWEADENWGLTARVLAVVGYVVGSALTLAGLTLLIIDGSTQTPSAEVTLGVAWQPQGATVSLGVQW